MTKVLITGAGGFIGKNLQLRLVERSDVQVLSYTRNDSPAQLPGLLQGVSIVFHLAGVNRPQDPAEFQVDNIHLTRLLADSVTQEVRMTGKPVTLVFASSTQANLDNLYGKSKREAEQILSRLAGQHGVSVYIFRLPNMFGKWSRPGYNSVVATFCHNIARDLPIQINDPAAPLTLVYVDDLISRFVQIIDSQIAIPESGSFSEVSPQYQTTVGALAAQLRDFRESRTTLMTARVGEGLSRALYATYISYLPVEAFAYSIPQYCDSRGVFVEILKTPDCGQFSFFTAHPGVTRGSHYHHSKTEKFLVLKGQALFRFRHMQTGQLHELYSSSENPRIVETIPGWAHDIKNVGLDEMVVMLWANEIFDRDRPDTFSCTV